MASIDAIEGIGPKYATALRGQGIRTCERLLTAGAAKKDRKALAADAGISETLILEWVNRADLMRVPGVSTQYSDLLEAAGVDTVKELRRRKPENLAASMAEVNEAKNLVRRPPSAKVVAKWVSAAGQMDAVVTH